MTAETKEMLKKAEKEMYTNLTPTEVKILMQNRADIEYAMKIKKALDHALVSLISIDAMILTCYMVTFLIMRDHAWFDWMDIIHIILILVMIICVADTVNVYRNLKYLLVFSLFLFAIDIIISAFLRPLTLEHANPFNTPKVDLKTLLLVMQAMLTVVDFVAFSLAVYFRYVSALSDEDVHSRYVDIELARSKYLVTAMMQHLTAEGHDIKVKNAAQRLEDLRRDRQLKEDKKAIEQDYANRAVPVYLQKAFGIGGGAPPPNPPVAQPPAMQGQQQPPAAAAQSQKGPGLVDRFKEFASNFSVEDSNKKPPPTPPGASGQVVYSNVTTQIGATRPPNPEYMRQQELIKQQQAEKIRQLRMGQQPMQPPHPHQQEQDRINMQRYQKERTEKMAAETAKRQHARNEEMRRDEEAVKGRIAEMKRRMAEENAESMRLMAEAAEEDRIENAKLQKTMVAVPTGAQLVKRWHSDDDDDENDVI